MTGQKIIDFGTTLVCQKQKNLVKSDRCAWDSTTKFIPTTMRWNNYCWKGQIGLIARARPPRRAPSLPYTHWHILIPSASERVAPPKLRCLTLQWPTGNLLHDHYTPRPSSKQTSSLRVRGARKSKSQKKLRAENRWVRFSKIPQWVVLVD